MPAMAVESGPAGRGRRGTAGRGAARHCEFDLVRHGRHDGEGEPDRRRRDHGDRRIRGRRRAGKALAARHRPSGAGAGYRSCRGQRRRRQHRLGRSRRFAAGRSGKRRGDARPGRLWTGRPQADCQRRRYRARLARPRGAARRRSADRRGCGRESHHARDRGAARAAGCRGRREDRGGRQRQHGRSAAHRLGRTRPRSARLRIDRIRWGGAGACGVSRRGARDRGGRRAAGDGRVLSAGTRRQRRKTRVQPHALRRSRQRRAAARRRRARCHGGRSGRDAGGGACAIRTPGAEAGGRCPLSPASLRADRAAR